MMLNTAKKLQAVLVKYPNGQVIQYNASSLRSWMGFFKPIPSKINSAAFLENLGVQVQGAKRALQDISLNKDQMGEFYLNLFINQVKSINIKDKKTTIDDLIQLNPQKISFVSRKDLQIEPITKDAQIIVSLPSNVQIKPLFSEPGDITEREKVIKDLIRAYGKAEKSIFVAMFAFTEKQLRKALVEAKQKGVEVIVVLDRMQAEDNPEHSQKSHLEQAGIDVRLGSSNNKVHHKFSLIDDKVLYVGSFNLTKSAKEDNFEDLTRISGSDLEVQKYIQSFKQRFVYLYQMFRAGLGPFVASLNPVLKRIGLKGFHHKKVPLYAVKRDAIKLSRATEAEFEEVIKIGERYTFDIDRKIIMSSLLDNLPQGFDYLKKALLSKEFLDSIPQSFFLNAASPSRKHHKVHVNNIGGHVEHVRDVINWCAELCDSLDVSPQIRAETQTTAAAHDLYLGRQKKKNETRTIPQLTAEFLSEKTNLSPDHPVITSVRNQWHKWGGTPIGKENAINDFILYLADYLSRCRNIYLNVPPEKENEILEQLTERPFPDLYNKYLQPIYADPSLFPLLLEVTPGDQKIFAAAYAFLEILPEEQRKSALMASVIMNYIKEHPDPPACLRSLKEKYPANHEIFEIVEEAYNRIADGKVRLTRQDNWQVWVVCLADWLVKNNNIKVYTYEDVEEYAVRVRPTRKGWTIKEQRGEEIDKLASGLQNLMFEEYSEEFLPEIDKQLRQKIKIIHKIELQPIAGRVIEWMMRAAGSIQADEIYDFFFGSPANSEQNRRLIQVLKEANQSGFDQAVIKSLNSILKKHGLKEKAPYILNVLKYGAWEKSYKTLKEIRTVLINSKELKPNDVDKIMEELSNLSPSNLRTIWKLQEIMTRAKVKKKSIDNILKALKAIDPSRSGNICKNLNGVLKHLKVGDAARRNIVKDLREIIENKAREIIERLEEKPSLPKPSQEIKEFTFLSAALGNKGITRPEQAKFYLESIRGHDYQSAAGSEKEMEKAYQIINQAVKQNQKILIYSNPSFIGTLEAAALTECLRDIYNAAGKKGEEYVTYHTLDIKREGFSMDEEIISQKSREGIKVIITTNNEDKSHVAISRAKYLGMEVIAIDTGPAPAKLSAASLSIRPPDPSLSGPAMIYRFMKFLHNKSNLASETLFLDWAALGILGNPQKMSRPDQNMVYWGLKILNSPSRNIGLDTLLEIKELKEKTLDGVEVGFRLLPILKGACCMGRRIIDGEEISGEEEVIELFLSKDRIEALIHVERIMKLDKTRKEHELEILKAIRKKLESNEELMRDLTKKTSGIVLKGNWDPYGIMGLVGAQLCRDFYSPIVLIDQNSGIGEIRSIPEIGAEQILNRIKEKDPNVFIEISAYGRAGHFTISKSRIDDFEGLEGLFNEVIEELTGGCKFYPNIEITAELPAESISLETKALFDAVLGPSKSNPESGETNQLVFLIRGVEIPGWNSEGRNYKHLTFQVGGNTFFAHRGNNPALKGTLILNHGNEMDLAFTLGTREKSEGKNIRPQMVDIKKHPFEEKDTRYE